MDEKVIQMVGIAPADEVIGFLERPLEELALSARRKRAPECPTEVDPEVGALVEEGLREKVAGLEWALEAARDEITALREDVGRLEAEKAALEAPPPPDAEGEEAERWARDRLRERIYWVGIEALLAGLDEDVAQKAADEVAREAVQRFSYAKMQIAIEDRNKGEEP